MADGTSPDVKRVIKLALLLSSVAMVALAALTLLNVTPFPPVVGWLFLAVATVDVALGYIAFK